MNLFMEQEMNWGKTEVGVVSKKILLLWREVYITYEKSLN